MNSHLLPLFVSYSSSGEKFIKYQAISSCVIKSVILMTTLFYQELILQGEIWCWSLLGLKRVKRWPNANYALSFQLIKLDSCRGLNFFRLFFNHLGCSFYCKGHVHFQISLLFSLTWFSAFSFVSHPYFNPKFAFCVMKKTSTAICSSITSTHWSGAWLILWAPSACTTYTLERLNKHHYCHPYDSHEWSIPIFS